MSQKKEDIDPDSDSGDQDDQATTQKQLKTSSVKHRDVAGTANKGASKNKESASDSPDNAMDSNFIQDSDFSEIYQYDDEQDSNEEEYEIGVPTADADGAEGDGSQRNIEFKLENYSDDPIESGRSSEFIVNLDNNKGIQPIKESKSPMNKTPRVQKSNLTTKKASLPVQQDSLALSNQASTANESQPVPICPSPIEPTRKDQKGGGNQQKIGSQPQPMTNNYLSEAPSKVSVVKATEILRQQQQQQQNQLQQQTLITTSTGLTLPITQTPITSTPKPEVVPKWDNSMTIIPSTLAGRMSLKDKMKADQGLTQEQIEMNRHLSHVSNEYRRSQLRNQRQQAMEQFIRAEKNLTVIQQIEENSSGDDIDSARYGEQNTSQILSDKGLLAQKNKQIFSTAKKFMGGTDHQQRDAAKYRQRNLNKTEKKGKKEEENKRVRKRLIFNTYNTNYPVIDLAAKNLGYKTVYKDHNLVPSPELKAAHRIAPGIYATIIPEEFDVVWFDTPIKEDTLQKIKQHQRVSQYTGIQIITNKSKLAKNLTLMKKAFPLDYNFFPMSYNLPNDTMEFKKALIHQRDIYIVKPSHDCQGRGIYLASNLEDYHEDSEGKPHVAQTYIDNPLLIDKLKFDLRLYVLIFGIQPLRIYLFDDGLARFATTPYQSAARGDKKNLFIHLTNYAINKKNENYVQNENFDGGTGTTHDGRATPNKPRERSANATEQEGQEGGKKAHKRSLKQIYQIIEEMGRSTDKLKRDIKDLVIKTLITGQSHLHHIYKTNHPDDMENQMCFQILGFDVMIDSNLKPWLIEVNQSPSFATDSAFDFTLKKKLMEDTFRLLNLTPERKTQYMEQREKFYIERLMTAHKGPKLSYEEKEMRRFEIDNQRDKDDKRLLRNSNYELIFPLKDDDYKIQQYNSFLNKSREIQEAFIHGKRNIMKDKNVYDFILQAAQNLSRTGNSSFNPDKFMNNKDRAKSTIESKTQLVQKKKSRIDEQKLMVKQKKEIDYQRLNILENIQSQKDEQKNKDKTAKKKLIQQVKTKAPNPSMTKDLSAQVQEIIDAQHKREQEQKQQLQKEQQQVMESANSQTIESSSKTQPTKVQLNNFTKILGVDQQRLKNPYTQLARQSVTGATPIETRSQNMTRNAEDRCKTPVHQKSQTLHKKTKSINKNAEASNNVESRVKMERTEARTGHGQMSLERPVLQNRRQFPTRQFAPSKDMPQSQQQSHQLIKTKNEVEPNSPNILTPKSTHISPRIRNDLQVNNELGSKSQIVRQRGTSTVNIKSTSQFQIAHTKSDVSFKKPEIIAKTPDKTPTKDSKTADITITVPSAMHREKKPERDKSRDNEYSVPPPPLRGRPEKQQQAQSRTFFLSKYLPINIKGFNKADPAQVQKETQINLSSMKRSSSQENKKEIDTQNKYLAALSQPHSATGFASTQKPNLGEKNNKSKPNSPRKQQSHSSYQPKPVEQINYKEIIGKIEERDQKEIIKTQKSNSQRKKVDNIKLESNHKKSYTSKFVINDFSSQKSKDLNEDLSAVNTTNLAKSNFFEKVQLDNSQTFDIASRNSDQVIQRASIDSQSKTVDFYQKELQKLQRVDKQLKKENKQRTTKKKEDGSSFLSPQKKRKELIEDFNSPSGIKIGGNPYVNKTEKVKVAAESPRFNQRKAWANNAGLNNTTQNNNNMFQSTMSGKSAKSQKEKSDDKADEVVIDSKDSKTIQSQFAAIMQKSIESIPSRDAISPAKNYFMVNKEGVKTISSTINNDDKDRKQTEGTEVENKKETGTSTPMKTKQVKKIPNQNRARDQFIQLIEVLKREEKDPIFDLEKDFKINQVIGKGTFAVIKKATHVQTGYQVALKTYQKKLLTRKSQLMAIHREIYILAGLNHPNIMKLFEVIDTRTHVNLIMQLCSGPNLLDYQKKNGEKVKFVNNKIWTTILPEDKVKPIFKQLVNAIDYMHKLGLVHRDLRIENVIINEQFQEVKFIDFGFATSFQANKQLQIIGGTPQIKDPKVIKSKTLTCQLADVYSMGIILFILLTGGVPHWALIESDIYQTVQSEKNQLPIREDSLTGQWIEIFSKPCCQLFKKMIMCDSEHPISMEDILNHPWLVDVEVPNRNRATTEKKQQLD